MDYSDKNGKLYKGDINKLEDSVLIKGIRVIKFLEQGIWLIR